MSIEDIDILKRAIAREKASRKAAEKILEAKSAELYEISQELQFSNTKLDKLLKEKTSELQGVFGNIVDAYIVMDLFGSVLKMNDAAISLLGFDNSKEDFNLLNLADVSEAENVMNGFEILITEGSITDFQVTINTKSQGQKLVHINASLIVDENNKPIAAQGIVRDITEISNLEIQKEKLLLKLENSNEELQEYAHVVSHDLKSPLRSIDALIQWIKEDNKDKLDEVSLQNFNHIEITLEKMEQLISDVLKYSSISSNNTDKTLVNLNVLVNELTSTMYFPEKVGLLIHKKLPEVFGHKTKLQQLFQNLISNAVKFIDKDKGLIQIDFKEEKDHFEFSIKDNGMGIEKKFFDKIFKIFHSLNKNKESTGIGLSIVKKIVDLHEGKIWLESELEKGTTFYFTLKK
jgi:PAS domain S-box-containing protein